MGIAKKPLTQKINTATGSVKRLSFYAKTLLPTSHGSFECLIFRDSNGLEHVAMVKGDLKEGEDVLCRIHSECLTSEVFGSQKCDCKHQLDSALDEVQRSGRGVVLYLRQEGRGIGLGNKIKAYALQEEGLDTVDANQALGLPIDARNYEIAAEMLQHLGIRSVRLLTNNPLKIKALADIGIAAKRQQLEIGQIPAQAAEYVRVKQKRLGHIA